MTESATPTPKQLRYLARNHAMRAILFTKGRSGMTVADKLHALSHAKQELLSAISALEAATHEISVDMAVSEVVEDDIHEGVESIEKWMESILPQNIFPAEDDDTDVTDNNNNNNNNNNE